MLKNIQHIYTNVYDTGRQITIPVTVVPTKCVVMLYGNQFGEGVNGSFPIFPNYNTFLPTAINIVWPVGPSGAGDITITIIEYI